MTLTVQLTEVFHYPPDKCWYSVYKLEAAVVAVGNQFDYEESPNVKVSFE